MAYLEQILRNYRHHASEIGSQIRDVVQRYPDLRPKITNYRYADGEEETLVTMAGTIQVPYRGNTYNIPVAIYLPLTYPLSSPICFVKPTDDMLIKPSRIVDDTGMLYFSCLSEWRPNRFKLKDLINHMVTAFSRTPPVFRKPIVSNVHTTNNDQTRRRHSDSYRQESDTLSSERIICKICWDKEISIIFTPCGHLMSCVTCSQKVTECPVCRRRIMGKVQAYF